MVKDSVVVFTNGSKLDGAAGAGIFAKWIEIVWSIK